MKTQTVKYPNITVELTEGDGNAFAILGKMKRAFKLADLPDSIYDEFRKEATSGDYDHLLQTCMEWVEVE